MATSYRLLGTLLLLTTSLLGVGVLQSGWTSTGDSSKKDAGKHSYLLSPPTPQTQMISKRIQVKIQVITNLLNRKISLLEAANWFAILNQESAFPLEASWQQYPGTSENEKICRQVISWAETQLLSMGQARLVPEMMCLMEDELSAHIARYGSVVLTATR